MNTLYTGIKGNIVLTDRVINNGVVIFSKGKITGIFEEYNELPNERILNAEGSLIIPGSIDAHVHCFSSLEEGFINAGNAAAAGGVTTIIEMPYDASGMIATSELFLLKKQRVAIEAVVDIALLATIKKKNGLDQIPLLAKNGACGFKISMFNTDDIRFPRIDDGEMLDIFKEVAKTGLPIGIHAENDEIVRKFISKYESLGCKDPKAHCLSRPKVAEATAVVTALELAYWSGVRLHIYHCSFSRIFDLVNYYRTQGTKVTVETCPHYLTLCEDDMVTIKAKGKINPPLRNKEENALLWEKISMGSVDIITSDHAPWKIISKQNEDIFKNSSGAPGVETLLTIIYSEGVATGKITINEMVKLLSETPARIFGLDHCKGKISIGMDADFAIINPRESYKLEEEKLHSSAMWSPYNEREIKGKITHTFLRGELIYKDKVLAKPGYGKFIRPIPVEGSGLL